MERHSLEAVITSLNAAQVRYLVVGGLAVVAHGYLRTTADLDLVLALDSANAMRGVATLAKLGFRPTVPVDLQAFANRTAREEWATEKGAVVLRLHSEAHRTLPVDLFLREPFDFERAYGAALREEIAPGVTACFASYGDLIALKHAAGRPQDLADIRQLEEIQARLRDERNERP